MGLFGKKNKKVVKPQNMKVSPQQLVYLIELAEEAIDEFQIEYDIEFTIGEDSHTIGIDYDRIDASKKGVHKEYLSYYVDAQKFNSLASLWESAMLADRKFSEYEKDFVIDIVYEEPLAIGDIEDI